MSLLTASPSVPRDLPVWQHACACLRAGTPATLLLVVSSSGSSPGRQGFKMTVAPGSMAGSVGGGIMEHKFVELARSRMAEGNHELLLRPQIHRSEAPHHRSGMICSGEQTLLLLPLRPAHLAALDAIVEVQQRAGNGWFEVRADGSLHVGTGPAPRPLGYAPYTALGAHDWRYTEHLGFRDQLTIIGAGHVALALSRIVATLDFHLTVIDDRPGLNTLLDNPYAHQKHCVPYHELAGTVPAGPHHYVVIMTFGYRSDAVALRQLINHPLAYLGLMGSEAKIAQLFAELRHEGYTEAQLSRVHAPVGVPISSRTPEEIAISVAAQLIQQRNAPPAART